MTDARLTRLSRPGRPDLAVRRREGASPAVVFLPGYASDMDGTKAVAIDAWAAANGQAAVRFDYAGCGASGGAFADQTLEDWRDDALAVIDATDGPLVLVGSSLGGWIMLLAALARPERVVGLVGIAAAPDFTDWGYDDDEAARLKAGAVVEQPSAYGDPLVTHPGFWASGQRCRLLEDEIALDVPVTLIHGQEDRDVPVSIALRLSRRLRSAAVKTVLIKDGDHRLSRPQDIAVLLREAAALVEPL